VAVPPFVRAWSNRGGTHGKPCTHPRVMCRSDDDGEDAGTAVSISVPLSGIHSSMDTSISQLSLPSMADEKDSE
jgi:hypothetical protein